MQLFYLPPVNLWLMFPSRAERSGISSKLLRYRSWRQGWVEGREPDHLRRWQLFLWEGLQCLLGSEHSHIRVFETIPGYLGGIAIINFLPNGTKASREFGLMETEHTRLQSESISKDNHCCQPPRLSCRWSEMTAVEEPLGWQALHPCWLLWLGALEEWSESLLCPLPSHVTLGRQPHLSWASRTPPAQWECLLQRVTADWETFSQVSKARLAHSSSQWMAATITQNYVLHSE